MTSPRSTSTVVRLYCPSTGKRCYRSERDAKRATAKASNSIRVYRCPDKRCRAIHVTNRER